MNIKILFGILIGSCVAGNLYGWKHTWSLDARMNIPAEVKVEYISAFCRDDSFTLKPGQTKTIDVGLCTAKSTFIRLEGRPRLFIQQSFTGNTKFRIIAQEPNTRAPRVNVNGRTWSFE